MIDYTKDGEFFPRIPLTELGIDLDLNGHQFPSDENNVPYFEVHWMTIGGKKIYQAKPQFPCEACGVHASILQFDPEKQNHLDYYNQKERTFERNIVCQYSKPINTEVVLPIPSGKMIVTDNLIRDFKLPKSVQEKRDASNIDGINNTMGRIQATYDYAKHCGILYVSTISGSALFQRPDGSMCFGSFFFETDEELVQAGFEKQLAYIIDDLWAYCAVDYDHYVNSGGNFDNLGHYTIVDVEPGDYKFINYVESYDKKDRFDKVLTEIVKI